MILFCLRIPIPKVQSSTISSGSHHYLRTKSPPRFKIEHSHRFSHSPQLWYALLAGTSTSSATTAWLRKASQIATQAKWYELERLFRFWSYQRLMQTAEVYPVFRLWTHIRLHAAGSCALLYFDFNEQKTIVEKQINNEHVKQTFLSNDN